MKKREVEVTEVANIINEILRKGAFLTSKSGDKVNSMVIGWGTYGVEWGKPIFAIYIREGCKGLGIGKALYEKLETILRSMGIRTMTAAVASVDHDDPYLTNASISFHLRMGFTPVGTFHNAGCKFGRWYDLTWLEKTIGEYEGEPEHPKSIADVRRQFEEEHCCE